MPMVAYAPRMHAIVVGAMMGLAVMTVACGGTEPAGGPQACAELPAQSQYDACAPVDAATPGCMGSGGFRPDPGTENVRYPVGCHITYPVCDGAFGVPYDCTCQTFSGPAEWYCPV